MAHLDQLSEIKEWRDQTFGPSPWEVKTVFRFLTTLRSLKLIGTDALMHSTGKLRVAKVVMGQILKEYE